MATTWKLKDFLHEKRVRPARLAEAMQGRMTRTAVYGLVNKTEPKAIYLASIDALLPALRKVTGEEVEIGDLLVYEPDPEPADEMDEESRVWFGSALTPPLEPWEWGPEGEPEGFAVDYVPGQGWLTYEDDA